MLGKFLAAWVFAGIALLLTFPIWLIVNYLGQPDNGAILVSYLGSWLMAGAFIAIGACISALTKNQVIAFVVGAAACFLFLMSGLDLVLAAFRPWAPPLVVDTVASFSFLTHFGQLTKGVIDLATAAVLRLADRRLPDRSTRCSSTSRRRPEPERPAMLASLDRRWLTVAGIVLAIVTVRGAEPVRRPDLRSLRLDLTENRQFTLSRGHLASLLGQGRGAGHLAALRLAHLARRQPLPRLLRRPGARPAARLCRAPPTARSRSSTSTPSRSRPRRTGRSASAWRRSAPTEDGGATGYLGIAGTNSTDDVDVIPVLSPERESLPRV